MTHKTFAVAFTAGLLVCTAASAADFDVPVELPGGTVLLQTVQRTISETKAGQTARADAAYSLRVEVEPTQSGEYRMKQSLTGVTAGDVSVPTLAFEADASPP